VSRLPRVRANEVIRALKRAGFQIVRTKGSHHVLKHADGRRTVVPVHAGEIIGPALLRLILADCEMSDQEFRSFL
jgi:predicted RNA binding protein YcfA (HicA-like mRNA interferase family)